MASYQVYNQYGRQSVSAQQQSMTWNGSQWVNNESYVQSGTHSSYSSQAQEQSRLHTDYYHKWKAIEEAERNKVKYSSGEAKQEAERQAEWAKYYAEMSSRVAHHYHNNPHGQPPPLPPAPPQQTAKAASKAVGHQDKQHTTTKEAAGGGLQRYVKRCMSQCAGKQAKAAMQNEVEKVIAEAIEKGSMHTTNWDNKPLIPVPGEKTTVGNQYSTNTSVSSNTTEYYGPRTTTSNEDSADTTYYGRADEGGSYYGPSSSSARAVSKKTKILPQNQTYHGRQAGNNSKYNTKLVENDSYYGSRIESKSDLETDYIPLSSSKLVKKTKKRKALQNADNGFERSSVTMANRANRFRGGNTATDATTVGNSMAKYMGKGLIGGTKKLDEEDYENMTVKGTCTNLEKNYLRLTAPPRAELVRPEPILKQHLTNLKAERLSKNKRDYAWFCSQFKALRQDLTVQRIISAFTVDVYETHARVALEENDLNEYNQSQTQLKELYLKLKDDTEALKNVKEFLSLRLIYYVFLTGNKKYEEGSSDISNMLLTLTPEHRQDPSVAHALKVRSAVADHNYHLFFRLRAKCPTKSAKDLMEFMLPNVRQWALHRICKAYRPTVSIEFVLVELGFAEKEFENATKWLESCGIVLSDDKTSVKAKDCVVRESDLKGKNSLI